MLGTFGKVQNSLQVDDFSRSVGNGREFLLKQIEEFQIGRRICLVHRYTHCNKHFGQLYISTYHHPRSQHRKDRHSQLVSVMQFSPTPPPRRDLALHSQRDPPKYIIAIFFTKLNTFPQSAKYFGLNSRNFLQLLLPGSERRKKRFPKLLRESSVSVSGRITTR